MMKFLQDRYVNIAAVTCELSKISMIRLCSTRVFQNSDTVEQCFVFCPSMGFRFDVSAC